jgi:hypothetical protein
MAGTKKTFAMFGGAAALALAVGFGSGIGIGSLGNTATPATHPAASVTPAPANATPSSHMATLTDCIAGLDC